MFSFPDCIKSENYDDAASDCFERNYCFPFNSEAEKNPIFESKLEKKKKTVKL